MSEAHHRPLDRLGHPVEHLDFVIGGAKADLLRVNHGVRDAAHVVAAEGGINVRVVLQHAPRDALEVRVGLGLAQIDRNRPAALPRDDGLVIPVRALHQADGDAAVPRLRPRQQFFEIVARILEIRLDDEAGVVEIGKLRFVEQRLEQVERQVLHRVALHVEIDERAEFPGALEERPQPAFQVEERGRRVRRVNLRIKRGDLDRHVYRGNAPRVRNRRPRAARSVPSASPQPRGSQSIPCSAPGTRRPRARSPLPRQGCRP